MGKLTVLMCIRVTLERSCYLRFMDVRQLNKRGIK